MNKEIESEAKKENFFMTIVEPKSMFRIKERGKKDVIVSEKCLKLIKEAQQETAEAIFNEVDLNQFKISKKGCIDLHNRILELREKYLGEKK